MAEPERTREGRAARIRGVLECIAAKEMGFASLDAARFTLRNHELWEWCREVGIIGPLFSLWKFKAFLADLSAELPEMTLCKNSRIEWRGASAKRVMVRHLNPPWFKLRRSSFVNCIGRGA